MRTWIKVNIIHHLQKMKYFKLKIINMIKKREVRQNAQKYARLMVVLNLQNFVVKKIIFALKINYQKTVRKNYLKEKW